MSLNQTEWASLVCTPEVLYILSKTQALPTGEEIAFILGDLPPKKMLRIGPYRVYIEVASPAFLTCRSAYA